MIITSISPASGASSTLVSITGTGFSEKDSVFINGKTASIASTSDTQLVVKVPPQAGTGNVSVTVNGKSATGPVFTFTGNTYRVSTFAGSGKVASNNGTGMAAGFTNPYSIALDRHDNLYLGDAGYNEIRKITPAGVVTTFAGSGRRGALDVTGTLAGVVFGGVTVDGNGNLYFSDVINNKIGKITPDGAVSTFAGSGMKGSADGAAATASFYSPESVRVDGSGNVFVADLVNRKIRKITPSGVVSTFAGSGALGSADGTAVTASFNILAGMDIDAAGNLYVADSENCNIRKITSDGTVTTIAGKAGVARYADGTGLSANFSRPWSVAVDANGFLYVADPGNDVIRQITPEGAVTLLAGTVDSWGREDGPAVKARFFNPVSLAIDSHGNIFVADSLNKTIRKLTPQ